MKHLKSFNESDDFFYKERTYRAEDESLINSDSGYIEERDVVDIKKFLREKRIDCDVIRTKGFPAYRIEIDSVARILSYYDEWFTFEYNGIVYECDQLEGLFKCIEDKYINCIGLEYVVESNYTKINDFTSKTEISDLSLSDHNIIEASDKLVNYINSNINTDYIEVSIGTISKDWKNLSEKVRYISLFTKGMKHNFDPGVTCLYPYKNYVETKCRFDIIECDDEWFRVQIIYHLRKNYNHKTEHIPTEHYLCDQFDGLVEFLKYQNLSSI